MTELSDMIRAMADARLKARDAVARDARREPDSGILTLHPIARQASGGLVEAGQRRKALRLLG